MSSTAYVLVALGSEQPTLATPSEGRWYAGFTTAVDAKTGEAYQLDGAIARWAGEEFVDENNDPVDMSDYETLVEQQ